MNDTSALLALADRMLWVTALVAAPVLLASLAVGLVVGVAQAATSINEQTLTFVPKLATISTGTAARVRLVVDHLLDEAASRRH